MAPKHLNVKDTEYIDHQSKNYSITINMQEPFNQSAQFIKSFGFWMQVQNEPTFPCITMTSDRV